MIYSLSLRTYDLDYILEIYLLIFVIEISSHLGMPEAYLAAT